MRSVERLKDQLRRTRSERDVGRDRSKSLMEENMTLRKLLNAVRGELDLIRQREEEEEEVRG